VLQSHAPPWSWFGFPIADERTIIQHTEFVTAGSPVGHIEESAMRVRVLDDVCQGHTLCATAAPAVFGLREEDGHAFVIAADVGPEQEEAAQRAAIGCPERAIVVE
jgi:ferredoxin